MKKFTLFLILFVLLLIANDKVLAASCCVSTCTQPDGFGVCQDKSESPVLKDCSSYSSCNSLNKSASDVLTSSQTSKSTTSDADSSLSTDKTSTKASTACKTWYTVGTSDYNNCLAQYDTSDGGTKTTSTGSGTSSSSSSTTIAFSNPITATSVSQVLASLLMKLKDFVVIVAVIFIIIGGLMYMMSGGNENTIKRAKACIEGAIIGLVIVMASPIFLKEIISIFGGAGGLNTSSITTTMTLKQVAINILSLLLSILGIIAIISLVIGGLTYLTAYGDEKKIEAAKKIVKYAIIGIIVSLSSLIIVQQIGMILGTVSTSSSIWSYFGM